MSIGPVWFPDGLIKPLQDLKSKTGGYPPFLNISESNKDISSSLLEPTLYPQLTLSNSTNDRSLNIR